MLSIDLIFGLDVSIFFKTLINNNTELLLLPVLLLNKCYCTVVLFNYFTYVANSILEDANISLLFIEIKSIYFPILLRQNEAIEKMLRYMRTQ